MPPAVAPRNFSSQRIDKISGGWWLVEQEQSGPPISTWARQHAQLEAADKVESGMRCEAWDTQALEHRGGARLKCSRRGGPGALRDSARWAGSPSVVDYARPLVPRCGTEGVAHHGQIEDDFWRVVEKMILPRTPMREPCGMEKFPPWPAHRRPTPSGSGLPRAIGPTSP